MIRLQALESFTLERFDELKNIERVGTDTKGKINKNDKFECDKNLADYLLGKNALGRAVVKVIEIIPEKVEDTKIEENASKNKQDASVQVKKTIKKKSSKK